MSAASTSHEVHPDLSRAVIEQAPDIVIYADREGRIHIWNAAAEKVFGHAAGEVLGRSLDVIIPERFRQAHWEGFNRAVESGVVRREGRASPAATPAETATPGSTGCGWVRTTTSPCSCPTPDPVLGNFDDAVFKYRKYKRLVESRFPR